MRLQYITVSSAFLLNLVPACTEARAQAASAATSALTTPGGVVRAMRPAIVTSLTSADKQASGTFSVSLPGNDGSELDLFVRGSGPLDENDTKAPVVLGDLQGYRNAVKAEVGVNALYWRWEVNVPAQRSLCREVYQQRPPSGAHDMIVATTRNAPSEQRRIAITDSIVDSLVNKGGCQRNSLPPADRQEFDRTVDYGHVFLASLSAQYGRQNYKFADTIAVAFQSNTQHPNGATGGVGVYFPDAKILLATTATYLAGFDEGAPRQYCIPNGPPPPQALQCRSVPLGAPGSKYQMLLGFETRWFANAAIGLSPRLTFDALNDHPVGLELPILLRQPNDAGFTSALIGGWRSKSTSPQVDDRAYVALEIGLVYGIGLRF